MADRPRSRPSGRFDPLRFPAGLAALAVAALLVGGLLFLALVNNWYVGLALPALAGLLLAAPALAAVRLGHCRNRTLAAIAGTSAGALALAACFYADHCLRWGGDWPRLDRLPEHVAFRMRTDRLRHAGKGWFLQPADPRQVNAQVSEGAERINWIL